MTEPTNALPPDGRDDPENLHTLAGEYVLGSLPPVARRAVQARLAAGDTELHAAVDAWEARLLPLVQLSPPEPLPPGLWPRIASSLDRAWSTVGPDAAPARDPARVTGAGWRAWWQSLQLWRGLAATGFAAAAVLAAVVLQQAGQPAAAPQYLVVLVGPQDKAPGWVVQADARHAVTLLPLGTTAVPADKALQFWTKADSWNAPVSLGLVQPGQRIQIPLDRLPPLQANQLFELTLEPSTGSPTGRPTGPIQFIGRAVPVI